MTPKTTPISETFVLRYRAILRSADGKVLRDLTTRKSRKILALVRDSVWNTIDLTVTYGETGLQNRGTFRTVDAFHVAFIAFTDRELLTYVQQGGYHEQK